jgi:AGZA family xanthine/uracil permease-like MFS transporter
MQGWRRTTTLPNVTSARTAPRPSNTTGLDRYFKISQRGSTVAREIRGGVVTFFTMAYIVVLNPLILGAGTDDNGNWITGAGDGADLAQIAAVTALVAGVMTILMGVVANFPLALATGLGLNAFVAFTIVSEMSWADAMGLIVLEGLIILALVLTGFRKAVFHAVPAQLKIAISVGIGLFIALIGFFDAGFVGRPTAANAPPLELGIGGELIGWPLVVFVFGLLLMAVLFTLRVRGAILLSIIVATALAIVMEAIGNFGGQGYDFKSNSLSNPGGWNLTTPSFPDSVAATPDFSLLGNFSLFGAFADAGVVTAALFVFTLLLADFFDTMGTMTAIGAEAGLLDEEGVPPSSQAILIVDSIAAAAGGAASASSNTSSIESASGVGEGARTGLASVVTGVLFLLTTFLAPLVAVIPQEAAAPALVLVGFLMMSQVRSIDWEDLEIAIPAFLTVVIMPFSYSISAGIGAGFISYVVLKAARGKASAVHPLLWIVAALFVVYFAIHPISGWLGVS